MLYYTISIGLAWDLIKSIRDPFESNDERYKKIMLFAPIFSLFIYLGFYEIHSISNFEALLSKDISCGDMAYLFKFYTLQSVYAFLFFIYLTIALYIAYKGLARKGLNKEVR